MSFVSCAQDRILLHAPEIARGWNSFFGVIRGKMQLDGQLRELVINAIAVLNDAPYEWYQHHGVYIAEGGSQAKLEALKKMKSCDFEDRQLGIFNRIEQLTLKLARRLTLQVEAPHSLLIELRENLGKQQLVELLMTICAYNCCSRFLVAMRINAPDGIV